MRRGHLEQGPEVPPWCCGLLRQSGWFFLSNMCCRNRSMQTPAESELWEAETADSYSQAV